MKKINGKLKTELNSLLQQSIKAIDYIKPERQKQHLCNPERQRMIFITPTTEIPQSKI